MEQAVELTAGISFLILGFSYLFRAADWAAWFEHIQKQERRASLTIGTVNVLVSAFITGFHWIWQGMAMILTIIGLIAVTKGVIYLLFPRWLPAKLVILVPHYNPLLRFSGILLILITLSILYPVYQGR